MQGPTHENRPHGLNAGRAGPALAVLLAAGMALAEPGPSVAQVEAEMLQRVEAVTRAAAHDGVVPRFNQPKTVGCVDAEFRVREDIPSHLRQGLFARPGRYPAYLRFANATEADDSEKDIRGLSIRVRQVPGEVAWGEPGAQDFLLNSYPALFADTPETFLKFIRAREAGKEWRFFLNPLDPHLKALWIVFRARQHHLSPLDIRYWSTVPFRLGEDGGQVVKYSVSPCSRYRTERAVQPGADQLRAALKAHLQREPACLSFAVQLRTDPAAMPIEDASVIWDEADSPFVEVATLTIEDQPFDSAEALARCERSRFNPWQGLRAHEPLGRMNAVRRQVYAHGAAVRQEVSP
ncbi:MAG TPA: catalase [Gammaproteobacteria bacterium]|nr:catalase [Gammaproteobacteria bacterium]